ncbi:TOMM precursor leader peptide-binding protein [Microlunatus ginsengisoli]|uniref:ThiF family adenylyltransferase n=1 Tax=Microlunatus ginsengisoli TaxID=363863 RepID=A0ABP7A120_9ACTN
MPFSTDPVSCSADPLTDRPSDAAGSAGAPAPVPRPVLRPGTPILLRPGAVQIGLDSPDAVVISPAGAAVADWLRLVDGSRSRPQLIRVAARGGIGPATASAVLDLLVGTGLVSEAGAGVVSEAGPAAVPHRIRLIGAGRLGRSIARLLSASACGTLELIDDDPVDRMLYPRRLGYGRQCEALAADLRAEFEPSGLRISAGPPWSAITGAPGDRLRAPSPPPDVTVLASDRLEVDRMIADTLLRDDQPHLIVRGAADGAVVGPLVLPGRTACVRCTDLIRRDRDPDWPVLLSQLTRIPALLPEPVVAWAAGTAVAELLALLAGRGEAWPETTGTSVELRDFASTRHRWPQHPACGCGWGRGHLLAS